MIDLESGKIYVSRDGQLRLAKATSDHWYVFTLDGTLIGKCTAQGRMTRTSESPGDLVELHTEPLLPVELTAAVSRFYSAKGQLELLEIDFFKTVWQSLPAEAKWLAMDSDGKWYWFERKPYRGYGEWGAADVYPTRVILQYRVANWKKSRQKRPENKS